MVADGKPADADLEKSVESFEEMVKRVTGKEDYKFGDLSAGAGERIVTTMDSIQNGTMNAMDKVVTTVARHGNTSAASVPLALDTAVRDGRIAAVGAREV